MELVPHITQLHNSPMRCVAIISGAGGSLISQLLGVAGCSRTLLEAQVPYCASASQEIIAYFTTKHVSLEVGRMFAQHAYKRATELASVDGEALQRVQMGTAGILVGLGATAAIQTDKMRRGSDRLFASTWTAHKVVDYALVLSKTRTREEQEHIVALVLMQALANAAAVEFSIPEGLLNSEESISRTEHSNIPRPIQAVLDGKIQCAVFNVHGTVRCVLAPYTPEEIDPERALYLLYPGSFQPLHYGHTELMRVASTVVQRRDDKKRPVIGTYEISASIVGKRTLQEEDFVERVRQFTCTRARVAITTAKLFVDKAKMFPHHGMVVGVDTARRVIDPQFYNNSEGEMIKALKAIAANGCYFVVGGRKHGSEWDDMTQMVIPKEVQFMFTAINPEDFRVDVSSTEIRARKQTPPSSPTLRPG